MVDTTTIWLADADSTHLCGKSLAHTLYGKYLTIGLNGDLGAGKTTFLQGFLKELGVSDEITSPTYALEQRYNSPIADIIHIDLYRLKEKQAKELLTQTDDFEGIRCVEWIEKAGTNDMCDIVISLADGKDGGRDINIEFRDMSYPTKEQILGWREDMSLPPHICNHCDAVAKFATSFGQNLLKHGVIIRPGALHTAGLIHDLMRFVDFKDGSTKEDSKEDRSIWNTWKLQYPGLHHEDACAAFLEEHGHNAFATIVRTHGLGSHSGPLNTIEQKLLFYSDKRVAEDVVVTLQERFDDFTIRYGNGNKSEEGEIWLKGSLELEKELTGLCDF
ncbi:tRNA (adenosine(37)-N6)-threonylcarbamoyltransferase complex ATPase subunit type 1 TsaE [Candidatus Peregrinibacteria bacterium]|jgi:tRNA threonylcarbamoyladenosine biosynthesis protein TsaE|nr:tRNA (adenosine(37)-N6)-threonylcarbamoyltransferase complex ATPase subunit type 1 TsaE [Candidatus Peregrinibacteria bacterium]